MGEEVRKLPCSHTYHRRDPPLALRVSSECGEVTSDGSGRMATRPSLRAALNLRALLLVWQCLCLFCCDLMRELFSASIVSYWLFCPKPLLAKYL